MIQSFNGLTLEITGAANKLARHIAGFTLIRDEPNFLDGFSPTLKSSSCFLFFRVLTEPFPIRRD
jgi:hypothetical protein